MLQVLQWSLRLWGRKMAKALEDADKRKVDYAVIVGERELKEGAVMLKDLTADSKP